MNRRLHPAAAAITCAIAAFIATTAHAQNEGFRVVTVPWVATNPAVPHDGVAGQPHFLQAVADGCVEGQLQFRWDLDGDGTYDTDFAAAPNRWNLGAQHTYEAAETRLFYPRVEGRCGEATASAEFPIRVNVDPPLGIRVNRAISNGLWAGHIQLLRDPALRRARFGGQAHNWADTAMLAQAMMNRGHRAGVDGATDPYLEDVQWMLHHVASNLTVQPDPAPQAGEDPDFNDNGVLLRVEGEENYVGGGCLEALASYGDMDYVPPPEAGLPAPLRGISLGELVQDAAEYFAWSQSEIPFNDAIAGGWDYSVNAGQIDTSQVGWAAVGLFAARINGGAQIADWVTDRLYQGVLFNDASRGGDPNLRGGYGYRTFNECGANYARSGAMLNALGFATARDRDDPQVQATVDYLGRNWGPALPDCWGGTNISNYYAMYQIAKGMRSFVPAFDVIGDGVDWYREYAQFLVDTQPADGRWNNDTVWMGGREITHALGLLVLIPTLFEAPPTAVAQGTPLDIGPGDTVTFTHGNSYVLDPTAPIVTYRWDFASYPDGLDADGDGRFDGPDDIAPEDLDGDGRVSGDEIRWEIETDDPDLHPEWTFDPALAFGDELVVTVRLQVEDTLGRTDDDAESVVIRIAYVNHPPVAAAHPERGGEYRVSPGGVVRLDGRGSFDPDSDDDPAPGFPRDSLTSIAWDLDGDGTFETDGALVDYAAPQGALEGQTRVARLRVCDDGTWIGQTDAECGGDCSLCHIADARIRIQTGPDAVVDPAFVVTEGDTVLVDGGASNHPAGRPYQLAWACADGLPFVPAADGRSITIDASDIDGPAAGRVFDCTLTATGDGLTDVATFTVTVQNRAPTLTAVLVGEPAEGATVQIRAEGDDAPADRDGLRYSFDCDGDGRFEVVDSASPVADCPLDDGDYAPRVRVDDGDGGVTAFDVPPFTVPNRPPQAPPVVCPADVREGVEVVWVIEAADPGRGAVACALTAPVPDAAAIAACVVRWTPTYQQALAGPIDFTATVSEPDGLTIELRWSCDPIVRDEDADGLPDTWEEDNGTDPGADDCDDDLDGDGVSNCDEFGDGTLPGVFDGPSDLVLVSPIDEAIVDTLTPDLVVENATSPRGRPLTYEYALFEPGADDALATSPAVPEGDATTIWTVPEDTLEENATYEWTARADDGIVGGAWAERESFTIDAVPEPPTAPVIRRPESGDAAGDDPLPVELDNATDPDPGATLTYECEFGADLDFDPPIATGDGPEGQPTTTVEIDGALPEDAVGWIRCRAIDETGLPSDWSEPVDVTINRSNTPPTAPEMIDPAPDDVIVRADDPASIALTTGRATDADGDPLTYRIWISDDPAFPEATTVESEELTPDAAGEVVWTPPPLAVGRTWHWRARAHDGTAAGPFGTAQFTLEGEADPDMGVEPGFDADLIPADGAIPDGGFADTGLGGDVISGTGCACDATDDRTGAPLFALALIALGLTRRRRGRR
ncbi:MAG: Ig-like domain-containing protein [Myxococcales bacterium]|nr:Ig-like domain-containing protein [Myxococcales bacterium]MCB9541519.1 Ig-like domain-containing protein [Myxococcales bacterium]